MGRKVGTRSRRQGMAAIAAAAVVLATLFFVSFMIGQFPVDPTGVVSALGAQLFGLPCEESAMAQTVVWKVRLPRVCAAVLVGAALSVAGAVYQGLFRNPMVSPDILGASSGAGFGAALAILLSLPYVFIQVNAFVFGIVAVALAYLMCRCVSQGKDAVLMLILGGMIVSTLFSSFITLIKYVADPDSKLPEITYWLMGSLSTVSLRDLAFLLPPLLIGLAPLAFLRWQLNALAFGDEEAQAMGLNVNRLRAVFIFCATLLTSASVAIAGMIGWVGLIIPHMARFIVGPNCKELIPMSFLLGGCFLLVVDNVARSLFTVEVPLGILTSVIGAPFFFYLLFKRKREGA
ncbi:FecCD family ABC transporter permease [Adlercreutzia faecimuris]|uniref:Iron ABC transporter permease n=1 Tax=Adlercreutzia faecimuris TaxID=2897341 RepID=A0ABS9WFJ0_9ACTN|nr:iron ABC transporter permease [Adlercreutzia sp. JBNU-10]MCI2241633.1 iron ABC transporter permease [Adlercreutzia sp. JBNU-10]